MGTPTQRHLWLDVLRTILIIEVILIHTTAPFRGVADLTTWIPVHLLTPIIKTCIPLFFMITGALILPRAKDESISRYLLVKPALMALVVIVWELVYRLTTQHLWGDSFELLSMLKDVANGNQKDPVLWYMYRIMGVYMAAPFLSVIVSHVSTRRLTTYVIAAISLEVFCRLLSDFSGVQWWPPFDHRIYGLWFGFTAAGYLVAHRINEKTFRPAFWSALFVLGYGITLVAIFLGRINGKQGGHFFTGYDDPGIAIMSVAIFGIFFTMRQRINQVAVKPLWTALGASTLGIYVIHEPILLILRQYFPTRSAVVSVFIYTAVALVASYALTAILNRIPLVSYLVSLGPRSKARNTGNHFLRTTASSSPADSSQGIRTMEK